MSLDRENSDQLFARAAEVIPGGIYGHVAPAAGLPRHFPHYIKSGKGCRFEDVDGNEWLDFMCGFGAILHGYLHPEIEAAAESQRLLGSVFNQPSPVMVTLAESITSKIEFADWSVFAKNGSDLTTWAIRVAREHTSKPYVIKAKGAYHGVDAWCDPGFGGKIPEDNSKILEFIWNDIDGLKDLIDAHKNQISSLILTPYHHAAFRPSEMPSKNFWSNVENECQENNIVLILDDVRAGGRLHDGGSHKYFGFTPDMAVYSKGLGNGYAISACLGKEFLREASNEVFLTGSCWNDAVAMSAACKSLEISHSNKVADNVMSKGCYFASAMHEKAKQYKFSLKLTGPASMPYPWFDGDENLFLIQKFCEIVSRRGLYFHPHHNWFISNAHSKDDLDYAVEIAGESMKELSKL